MTTAAIPTPIPIRVPWLRPDEWAAGGAVDVGVALVTDEELVADVDDDSLADVVVAGSVVREDVGVLVEVGNPSPILPPIVVMLA
jgi:hypothetical protein